MTSKCGPPRAQLRCSLADPLAAKRLHMSGPGVPRGNPPPTWQTYARTLVPAWRQQGAFRHVRSFCLFIGMNRSGSSLVGSLLNAHRQALIAHELNALHFVRRRFRRSQLFYLLREQDQAFENADRQWYGYDYRVSGQWQGKSERLFVIGDKHAGGATHLLGRRPDLLSRLSETVGVPVKLVHLVRSPLDNIATLHRLQNLSLPAAAECYFEHTATNARLIRKYSESVITIHLEDFIRQPAAELRRLCSFLTLDAPDDYLHDCSQAVFSEPRQTRSELEWPANLVAEIGKRASDVRFLSRYTADIARFAAEPNRSAARAAA
jgi:hypothetical protein